MTPDRWRQIEDLYYAAQKRHPNERAALLECTDPEIRARVERMLEVRSSGQILDQSPDGFVPDPTRPVVAVGALLGPYKIEAQIGSGGMGTVYRAIDTRLGRVVAIKTASERYSERSQLEARAISTLNHPHVCTLYDVGPNYLVMEFIEGSTLAAEIQKGPLAPERVARYGAQIAGALAEAHALGIVHRDLKPSNVMVTRYGVKVLDFGLAKTSVEAHPNSEIAVTETGAVMGTPAYMAPEQAEGQTPSSVTDLFSLGLVLYEMAVGKLPFPGASLGQMLASGSQPAVPAPSRERVGVPGSLDALVAKLLEKDPAERPQSAASLARELSTLADRLAAPPSRVRSLLRPVFAVPAVMVFLALATGGIWLYQRSHQPAAKQDAAATNQLSYTQLTSFTDSAVGPTLSPDGRMVAFFRSGEAFFTAGEIWGKLLPNGEPAQLTHDPRVKYNLAFSPDGSRIAYTVYDNKDWLTYTVSSLGGRPELLLPNSAGLTWLGEHELLFSRPKTGIHLGIVTATSTGSSPREVYLPPHERAMAHYSYLSPDRKSVLVVEMDPDWQRCRVVPFAGGSIGKQVGPSGACTSAGWSPDGKWMYFGVRVAGRRHLWRQRFPDGKPEQITFGTTEEDGVAVAPDGRSLITSIIVEQNSVWFHDSRGDRPVSTAGYADSTPVKFSRDGKRIYFLLRSDSLDSPAQLWRADLDSAKTEIVVPEVSIREFDISDDEKEAVFSTKPEDQPYQLWLAPLDRSAPPRKIGVPGDAYPHFGLHGDIIFRLSDGQAYYVGVIGRDGTGRRKAVPGRIYDLEGLSPDHRMVIAGAPMPGSRDPSAAAGVAIPLDGKEVQLVCTGLCGFGWSPDGRMFYLGLPGIHNNPGNKTYAIRLPRGASLPRLPPGGIERPEQLLRMRGIPLTIPPEITPGMDLSTYAYIKVGRHSNLFRISLQ